MTEVPDGSVRTVLRVAWPLMISMLGHTLMGLVDTLMVSSVSQTAVAAVGLAHVASLVPLCAGMGFLNGVRVSVAQATGAGNPFRGRMAVREGARLALGIALVGLATIPFADPILRALGADAIGQGGSGLAYASSWYTIRVLGFPAQFVAIAMLSGFDGRGETRASMRVNVAGNLVNIALCALLVPGRWGLPALGVEGAAIATVAANVTQMSLALWIWFRQPKPVGAHAPEAPGDGASVRREILRLGGPTGIQWTLEVLSWTILGGFVARFGDAQMAAHSIAARVVSVSFMPGHAIGEATSILVGQAVGARSSAAAQRSYRSGLRAVLVIMGGMGFVFAFAPDVLLAAFHPSESARRIGQDLLLAAAVFQLFDGTAIVTQGALNGSGDSRFSMAAGITLTWAFWLPLSWFYVVHTGHGAAAAWAALSAQMVATSVVCSIRWRSGRPLARAIPALT